MIIPWKMRKKQPKKKAKITFFDSKKKKLIGLYGARTHDISVISTTRCQLRQQTHLTESLASLQKQVGGRQQY